MTAAVRPTQAELQRPGKFFAGYAEYLSGLGVPAAEADVLTPLGVLADGPASQPAFGATNGSIR